MEPTPTMREQANGPRSLTMALLGGIACWSLIAAAYRVAIAH
jgi:hypothetical protein